MKDINWEKVEEVKEFEKLPAGGYICGITAVEDVPEKEYLKCEFDIAEGEFKNYYRKLYDSKEFWAAKFIKSYKEKARGFFKQFLTSVEKSNPGFKYKNDEKELKRKVVGITVGYEEYINNNGEIKERIYADKFLPIDDIKSGRFDVPKLKKLKENKPETAAADFQPVDDDEDLPF